MSAVEDRLAALGLSVPDVAKPLAAYVPAVRSGDLIWTSGQLPTVGGELLTTGKVGADVTVEQAAELARICALNAIAAVKGVVDDLDSVVQIVKVVGFVASAPSFFRQPAVVNGASEVIGAAFADAGKHARSAVGVAVLPLDAPVEIELVARVRSAGVGEAGSANGRGVG